MTLALPDLEQWLAHCTRLHALPRATGLERVRQVRDRMGLAFKAPVITVAGTNGKGSTCAFLEAIALQAGYRVGLYSSPHLVHFEERCRVQGRSMAPTALCPHFAAVESARGDVALGYFEFTTLAILHALAAAQLDLIILEVGLGGRLDAVNCVDADCAVITCIGLDHTEILGPDRESIGREKAGILRPGCPAVISDPDPPASINQVAQGLGADLWLQGRDFYFTGTTQQWNWTGRNARYRGLAYPALRGANQLVNAAGALAALDALRSRLPVSAQAVRSALAQVELAGRFQVLAGQPVIVLDVAHNPHAAAVLAQNLDQMGFYPRTHAVLGAMADKDIARMLPPLMPLIEHWHVTDLPTPRAATAGLLAEHISRAALPKVADIKRHATPAAALRAALAAADPADRIIVFGSFLTVGGVLTDGVPGRTGPLRPANRP